MLEEIEDYAILLLDLKGNVMTWNKRAEKIKGYKAEEIIGKNFRLFYTQEDQARSLPEKLIEKAALKGKATDEGWRMRKDGTRFWGSILITAIHDEENAVVGFSKVTRDLTGKKKAEELEKSLGQTKEGLLKMFNASPSGMIMIDLKSRMYIDVNKNFLETFGYRRDEVVGLTLADMSLVTVETREKLFTKLKQQGYFKNEEVFCHSKDGREITCIVSADSFEMDGEKYILYVIHDISAIKAMERKIAESEEKFQKAFQASGAGITITKLSNGIYSEVNDAFTKLTGYSKEELIGHSSAEIDLVVDTGQREEMLRQLREHGSLEQVELTIRTKSGKLIEIISTIQTILLNEEKYGINIIYDITERKKEEETKKILIREIEKKNLELAYLNSEKDRFTGMVSHDLQNYIGAMILMMELMKEPGYAANEKQAGHIKRLDRSVNSVRNLVGDFMTVNRIQSGIINPVYALVNMGDIVNEVLERHEGAAANKSIKIHFTNNCTGLYFTTDASYLSIIADNLVSNAIKYSYAGKNIWVEASKKDLKYILTVKDEGLGIPEKDMPNMFGRFQRLTPRPTANEPSNGLGLSIVKDLTNALKATIECKSAVGEGTTFTVSF